MLKVPFPASFETIPFVCCCRGFTCVSILGLYYSAPMTTLYRVVKTRSSASLHWPLCLANLVNGALWAAYGLVSGPGFDSFEAVACMGLWGAKRLPSAVCMMQHCCHVNIDRGMLFLLAA
jgi:hypothetical protein